MDRNIFEAASKKLGAKSSKAKTQSKIPPPSNEGQKPPSPGPSSPTPPKVVNRDPEITDMLKNIEFMQKDLQNKLEYIKQKTGWGSEEIQKFMANPRNFSPKEWKQLQQNKDILGDQVWSTLGMELKPKESHRKNLAKERKGKTLGARKKWISMQ